MVRRSATGDCPQQSAVGVFLALLLFSLAGIPPLMGFLQNTTCSSARSKQASMDSRRDRRSRQRGGRLLLPADRQDVYLASQREFNQCREFRPCFASPVCSVCSISSVRAALLRRGSLKVAILMHLDHVAVAAGGLSLTRSVRPARGLVVARAGGAGRCGSPRSLDAGRGAGHLGVEPAISTPACCSPIRRRRSAVPSCRSSRRSPCTIPSADASRASPTGWC